MPAQELGPDYRRLRAATVLGAAGDGVLAAALPLLAAGITRQPLAVAGVVAAQRLPWVVVALLGSRWTPQMDRRTAMGLLRTLRAVTIGAVGAGQLAGVETLPLLYLGAAVAGTAELVVDDLAADAAGAGATASHRTRAVGGLALVGAVTTGVLGPPAGGALFRAIAALPFLVDALASSLAALLLLLLRTPAPVGVAPPASGAGGATGRVVVAGGAGARPLRALATATFLAGAGAGAAAGTLVLVALEELGVDPVGFGLLLAAAAAGGLAGAWSAPELGRVLGAGPALATALAVAAAGHGAVAVAPAAWAAGLGLVAAGAGAGAGLVLVAAVRHAARSGRPAPAVERGFHVVAWSAVPVGAVAGGILADATSVRAPFVLAAAALLGAAVLAGPATRAARPAVAGGAPAEALGPVVRAGA